MTPQEQITAAQQALTTAAADAEVKRKRLQTLAQKQVHTQELLNRADALEQQAPQFRVLQMDHGVLRFNGVVIGGDARKDSLSRALLDDVREVLEMHAARLREDATEQAAAIAAEASSLTSTPEAASAA